METFAAPKSFSEGEAPSSCQLIVACWPAVKVVEATGDVIFREDVQH
jgi:hypothetical protein